MWLILLLLIGAYCILFYKTGWQGVLTVYILGAVIWIFYPGYETGISGLFITEQVLVFLLAIGSLFPSGPKGIAAAGVGGYLAGRWMGRL